MKPQQLAEFIEQGIYHLDNISVADVDWVLVGALYLVGKKNAKKALLALDRLIFNKPAVRDALREQMNILLPQLESEMKFNASEPNTYTPQLIIALRMLGRVHGLTGRFLGLADDGTWAFPDPVRRAATLALIIDACKNLDFAADILLSIPAQSIHNEDISRVVRENIVDRAVILALVRRSREGTDAMKDACHAFALDLKEHGQESVRQYAGKIAFSSDSKKFFLIPDYIQEVYLAPDYDTFFTQLKDAFQLSDEQVNRINDVILGAWTKDFSVDKLPAEVASICTFHDKRDQLLAREIVLNAALLFPYHLGDQRDFYRSLGGNPEKDAAKSRLAVAAQKVLMDVFQKIYESMTIKDIEKERKDMVHLFESTLVFHLYGEDSILPRLNTTILQLLNEIEGYASELLNAMVKNEQKIGTLQVQGAEPTAANWIKDFLSFSKGEGTSLTLAKYLTQSEAVPKLVDREREALRKLLNTYLVLKGFPNSILELPRDQWMIIPYQFSEEEASVHERVMKIMSDALLQEEEDVMPSDQKPLTPTITIVEAPVVPSQVQAPVLPPVAAPVPQPVEPVKGVSAVPQPAITVEPQPREETTVAKVPIKIDFSAGAEAVLVKAGATLANDNRERVKNIIVTRLRNIRNVIETKDRLCAPTSEGGAGLASEDAEKLLQEAQIASKAITEGKLQEYVPSSAEVGSGTDFAGAKTEPDPAQAPKLVIKEVGGVPTIVEKSEKKTNGKKKEEKTPEPTQEPTQEPAHELVHEQVHEEKKQEPPQEPVKVPQHLEGAKDIPVVVTTQAAGSLASTRDDGKKVGADKKPIPDVKAPPRLVGPVDELRALTIKDIRRISEDPAVATQKIAEKINALGKESLSKKAEAIGAWKQSPAYQLYLEIGQMNLGQDVDKLAEERKAAGKEYLTAKEFDALLDLNERLRF